MDGNRNNCPGRVELVFDPVSAETSRVCSVYVGTCGYSYTEWVDSGFYPEGTRTTGMLGLYGRCFSVVELNYTWYQMARAELLSRMVEKAPPHMLFAAKLTRTMTHERADNWQEQLQLYRQGIAPLGDRLVAVQVQLPPGFGRSIVNRNYLAALLDGLEGLPVAVEFRHVSWAVDSVFAELARRSGNMQKKFNYDYSDEELQLWCEKYILPMAAKAKRGIVLFNNHVGAHAPRNGARLAAILAQHSRRAGK